MATPAYVWIYDEQGQQLLSDSKVAGRESSVEALSFTYGVNIPTDEYTGVTTGARQHRAAHIRKSFCPVSPILFDACCHGKTLKKVVVKWYRINSNGKEEEYFTHTLDDVKIVAYHQNLGHVKDKRFEHLQHEDDMELRFAKLTLKHHDGNIEAADQWIERS